MLINEDKRKFVLSNLSEFDLAWLVGILEGEGNFSPNKKPQPPRVTVRMTDKDVIEKVAKLFGNKKIYEDRKYKDHHKQAYQTYMAKPIELRVFLPIILPYMSERRQEQIRLCIDRLNDHPGYHWDREKKVCDDLHETKLQM
jgi:hypothetical protein